MLLQPSEYAQRTTSECAFLSESTTGESGKIDLFVRWPAAVSWIGEDVMNGEKTAGLNMGRPKFIIAPSGLRPMSAVDETLRQWRLPHPTNFV